MKIQPNGLPYVDPADTAAQDVRRRPGASAAASVPGSASVALSSLSSSLAKPDGDIDMARVEVLREAIRNGELRIDASRIADGLIDSVRELVQ